MSEVFVDEVDVQDIQLTRVSYRFGIPADEFVRQYRAGLRWCEPGTHWVPHSETITDTSYAFGHRWECVACANADGLTCPTCGGEAPVTFKLRRGIDIKLTRTCKDCRLVFNTAITLKGNAKEKLIANPEFGDRLFIRLDLALEAELCEGAKRLSPEAREPFRKWILGIQ